jgi:hypothetical protein
MIYSCFLKVVREKALRRRAWYSLDRIERGIINLTIRLVDRIKSAKLMTEVAKILNKINNALKNPFIMHAKTYGIEKGKLIIKNAIKWENRMVLKWRLRDFSRFLAFIDYNNPIGWKNE